MNDEKETLDPVKRRDIIKNILIVFLAVLLVLTFFSNTIMNKSLAEISTERAMSGKLTERIRGSGIVESNQSYEVKTDGNKVINTIMIKSGKEVKKGDVLFTVGGKESTDLTDAESALAVLELEYQKALLTPDADYSAENQAINSARDELNTAIAKRDNAIANQGNVQEAKNNYSYNKNQLNSLTKLQTKLQSVITAIDTDEYSMAAAEYTGEIIALKNNLTDAESAYNTAYSEYMQLISGGNSRYDEYSEKNPTEPETETTSVPTEIPTVPVQNVSTEEIENARINAEEKESIRDNAKAEYENYKYNLRADLVNQLADTENQIDSLNIMISDYENSMDMDSAMSIDDLNDIVQAKQTALEELIANLNKTKSADENQAKIDSLDLEAKKQEIDRQKQKIEKLKKENEVTEIKSKYDGVVSSVNVKPDEETIPDMVLAVIDITSEGYTAQITVDAQKAQKIKKGTQAEVINNWSGNVEAVVTDIKSDKTAGSRNKILVFSVTGDIESGSGIDLSIPCGNGNYDVIVPKSAVYEDKNGKFVLTVTSKSSPLGNRYYAERIDVEVLSSDEVSSAVQGNISQGAYIITTASKPVSPKDQVRMKDN